ncbi:hypothetical protein ACROYT_G035181 [Oculina patagonica]
MIRHPPVQSVQRTSTRVRQPNTSVYQERFVLERIRSLRKQKGRVISSSTAKRSESTCFKTASITSGDGVNLKKQYELQLKKDELNLQTEYAKAVAREEAYAQAEVGNFAPRNVAPKTRSAISFPFSNTKEPRTDGSRLVETREPYYAGRLYYLEQHTTDRAQEVERSCLYMKPEEGYLKAKKFLESKFGQEYKIAMAYVDKLTNCPVIKAEDAEALEGFAILLFNFINTLKTIGYSSQF